RPARRTNSGSRKRSRRRASAPLIAGWLTCSLRAARVTLPSLESVSKASRRVGSSVESFMGSTDRGNRIIRISNRPPGGQDGAMRILLLPILLLATAAAPPPPPPAPPLAITGVTVIDASAPAPRTDMTVVVSGGHIAMVAPTAAATLPRGARVLDGTGKFLIP